MTVTMKSVSALAERSHTRDANLDGVEKRMERALKQLRKLIVDGEAQAEELVGLRARVVELERRVAALEAP